MTPEQREKVKQLFEAMLEQEPAQWDTFLAEACDDEQVRVEVKSLLSEHESLGDFMHGPLLGDPESLPLHPVAVTGVGDGALRQINERYEVLGEAGRGGMGIVYRARDRETNAVVALKVLRPEIAAQPRVVERFKQELVLARRVTHRNVCRTYELLRFGDAVLITMEYVEGESLRVVLDRSSGVRLGRGLQWVGQVCEALAEAHAEGVVHRDLKPENIFIDHHGQVKVMDFGIARSLEAASTGTGAPIGTPAYMSPEQAEGKPVDARSDIYSLGLVMYEIFTGEQLPRGRETSRLGRSRTSTQPNGFLTGSESSLQAVSQHTTCVATCRIWRVEFPSRRPQKERIVALSHPDAELIAAERSRRKIALYQTADGKPVAVQGVEPEDQLIRFDKDGHHLYVYQYEEGDPEAEIYRLDTTSGRRGPWRQIRVPDPVVDSLDSVLLTPDGKWYACSYLRTVSHLYFVEGLK